MIAWIVAKTGLSAIVVKVILCTALAGAAFYGLRLWGNKQWAKGEQQGRVSMSQELEKQNKAEWTKRQTDLNASISNLRRF